MENSRAVIVTVKSLLHPARKVCQNDVTVDGVDEFDPQLNGIKGGGAALLFEKIVALNSKKNIWIVDTSKKSDKFL